MTASLKTCSFVIARTAAWIGPATGDDEGGGAAEGAGASGDATRPTLIADKSTQAAADLRANGRSIALRFTTNARRLKGTIAAAALALVACHAEPGQRGAGPGDPSRPIEMLVANDPETLDPRFVTDAVGMRTSRLLHAGLTRIDPGTLRPVPYVARSLEWVGLLTLRVTLRDGVRFHSGALLTADDVVATLRAFASAGVGSRHASTVEPIASVVAEDARTVLIRLRRPHATLLSDLDLPVLRRDQAESPPDPTGAALDGLGPFEIGRSERGQILLAPSRYGAFGPARHAVVLRTVHDENARAIRLYSGHADIVLNGLSPTLLPAVDGHEGLEVSSVPGANLTYLVVRVDRGPLHDVQLRRAISLGIDRATLTTSLFGGRATPADTVLPEGHWAKTGRVFPVRYAPEEARRILAASPSPGRLTLLTSTERLRVTVARTMAQQLEEVGLGVDVVPLELGTLLARLGAGDFDLAALQLPELTEPNVLRVFLHSAFIPPAGSNRGRVRNRTLDALLDDGDATLEDEGRARVYAEIEHRIRDELFIIPLWHEDQVAVVSPRARLFRPSPEGRWLSLASLP